MTKEEQKQLKRNPNVQAVSEKAITYTDECKRHFIAENECLKKLVLLEGQMLKKKSQSKRN